MNLRLLNSTTTTAGVQVVNIENVFTTDFNVYHIVGSGLVGNTSTASGVNLRWLDQSGSVHSTNYDYGQSNMKAETGFNSSYSTSGDRVWNCFAGNDDGGQSGNGNLWVFNPCVDDSYTYCTYHSAGTTSGNFRSYGGVSQLHRTGKVTGFQVEVNESASSFAAGGKILTYGMRVD